MLHIFLNHGTFISFDLSFVVFDFHFLFLNFNFCSKLVSFLLFDFSLNTFNFNFFFNDCDLLSCLFQLNETILISFSVLQKIVSLLIEHTFKKLDKLKERLRSCVNVSFLLSVQFSGQLVHNFKGCWHEVHNSLSNCLVS